MSGGIPNINLNGNGANHNNAALAYGVSNLERELISGTPQREGQAYADSATGP